MSKEGSRKQEKNCRENNVEKERKGAKEVGQEEGNTSV